MKYISKPKFIKAFDKMKRAKHLNSTQVAKRCQWSRSYIYQLTSKKSKRQRITINTVRRIAIGFGLNATQAKAWMSTMKSTASTENSYIKQRKEHNQLHSKSKSTFKKDPRDSGYNRYLANIIKNTMANKGMNTRALAQHSHLNEKSVSNIINNNAQYVSKKDATMLAKGLKINAKKLLYDHYKKQLTHKRKKNSNNAHHNPPKMHVSPTMFKIIKNISKLSNSDLLIINMIANRLVDTENRKKQ